jgi:hypothetical protein
VTVAAGGAINRTQLMVLGASPVVGFLAALALFLTLLAVGVLRR